MNGGTGAGAGAHAGAAGTGATDATGGTESGGGGGQVTGGATGTGGTTAGAGGTTTTGGSGGASTGGTGGGDTRPPLCDPLRLHTLQTTNPVIANFESGVLNWFPNVPADFVGGGYDYGDAVVTTPVWKTDVGHASTYSMYVGALNDSDWGPGMGIYMECIDVTAYKGIHFWAKGTAGRTVVVQLKGEMTTSVTDVAKSGGTCPQAVTCDVSANFLLNASWTEYTLLWSGFTATNVALPDDLTRLNDIGFHLMGPGTPPAVSLELWLDDVAFVGP